VLDVDSLLPGRRAEQSDREKLIVAIGYSPVRVSITDHPEICETFRTAIDRDELVDRIEPVLREARRARYAEFEFRRLLARRAALEEAAAMVEPSALDPDAMEGDVDRNRILQEAADSLRAAIPSDPRSDTRAEALNLFMSKFPSMSDEEDEALMSAFDAVWVAAGA